MNRQGTVQAPPVDRAMPDWAIGELARDDIPAARRAKLTAFVSAGVDAWSTRREAMRGELEVGREAMAHVLEMIGEQQQQAHERPPLEPCDLTEIVVRNATIANYSDKAHSAGRALARGPPRRWPRSARSRRAPPPGRAYAPSRSRNASQSAMAGSEATVHPLSIGLGARQRDRRHMVSITTAHATADSAKTQACGAPG